jgi:cell wall-associated NlpC family hydrolase
VTAGNLVRRSSGVSSLSFTLQNARRKYDGVFTPNDRVIVMLKRLAWMRVFSGYLNQVPLVTAWPMAVQLTASCSLKRLQYFFWDPGLPASENMVNTALASATAGSDDGGMASAVTAILENVTGWPAANIHIAGIPSAWVSWAAKLGAVLAKDLQAADAQAQQWYTVLGAQGTIGGQLQGGIVASNALPAGTYGGTALNAAQAAMAVLIYNAGASLGATERDQVVAIAVAMAESSLGQDVGPNGSHYGVFQQDPADGWGTVAQITDPTYAATAFYKALMKITNRDSMTIGQEGQAVQKSQVSSGANYQQYAQMATAVVNTLAVAPATSPAAQGTSQTKTSTASASTFLATALGLVSQHPDIAYQEGGDSAPNVAVPTVLDCSSFVQWVYFHTIGSLGGCPRTSQDQSSWCKASGSIVTAEQGLNTPGALMFIGSPGAASHVEISLGNGSQTVGAHQSGTYAGVVSYPNQWTCAGLAPGLDYSGSTGASPTATGSSTGVQLSTASAQPWYNPNDPFDTLFGNSPWLGQFSYLDEALAQALTGPRALLADQPLLPYIKNLMDSCMRSFCSGPNGDFTAWFPDYYGLWGTAAIMQVETIELQDFQVWWDDTNLVTHQYTVAPPAVNQLDLDTGTVQNLGPLIATTTSGVATIDIPGIMYALFGLPDVTAAQQQAFTSYIYKRFGARPDFEQLPGVIGPQGEFFSALYLFMQSWAYQYNADIPITFMPELWPGMLIQVPAFGFQAYCTTVTHAWQMGPGGGYSTTVNIAAPARLPGSDGYSGSGLIGLPLAGGLVSS